MERKNESEHIQLEVEPHTGLQQVGHGSLLLCNGVYISWWPKRRGKKMKKIKCGPFKHIGTYGINLQEDITQEGLEPDYIFFIPKENLKTDAMFEFWEHWQDNGHYSLLSQNCCSVVYTVLHKGGAPCSATLVWRPETLRRYMVIYLGGGSRFRLYWNMPHTEEHFKGTHMILIWKKRDNNNGHASLLLEDKLYISWFTVRRKRRVDKQIVTMCFGINSSSIQEDIKRMGREKDNALTFQPKYLDLSEMKRCWNDFTGKKRTELWGVNSFWLISQILIAGGAPDSGKNYAYWNGDTIHTYISKHFPVVTD